VQKILPLSFLPFVVLILVSSILCGRIIVHSLANQQRKQDLAELNNIKYGLFSVNGWKQQLSDIINDELKEIDLRDANPKELKKHVEDQLSTLIDKVDKKIRDTNKKSTKGRIKQAIINALVDKEDIKKGIPTYADAIIKQLQKPRTQQKIKGAVTEKVEEYLETTFDKQDETPVDTIVVKTLSADPDEAKAKLESQIKREQDRIYLETWLLIALSIAIFVLGGFSRNVRLPGPVYIVLLLTLTLLLAAGVTTPMIDLEAKISELSFTLLDHDISFKNQVLYFQTKSILNVFSIMIQHPQLQMKAVGILMVMFSIFFPLFKLFSSLLYYYDFKGARKRAWVQFFVIKSGKWSMTDVLVVAIFMAYIGFNGVISSQLEKLSTMAEDQLTFLATNGTSLQPGFFLFLSYTILAMFLSGFLTREVQTPAKSGS
jgi:translation elongation factor EF-G